MNFLNNIANFSKSLQSKTEAISSQATVMLDKSASNVNANLVSDPEAGENQLPSEDAHPEQAKLLKQSILNNLGKLLSDELHAVGKTDYTEIETFISALQALLDNEGILSAAVSTIKQSRAQLGDVVQTNSVSMESGNTVDILSSNEVKVLRSSLLRAGTAIRNEAPVITETAQTRIMFAHSLIQEADLMIAKAQNILQAVKDEFGITANNVGIIASGQVRIKGTEIHLNPEVSVDAPTFETKSEVKKQVQLPQFKGMSPVPAFVPKFDPNSPLEGA